MKYSNYTLLELWDEIIVYLEGTTRKERIEVLDLLRNFKTNMEVSE